MEPDLAQVTSVNIAHFNPDEQWQQFKSKFINVLVSIGTKPNNKKDRKSREVWSNIELWKELKRSMKSDDFEDKYSNFTGNIQRQCRRDENRFLEDIYVKIYRHAEKYQTADRFMKDKQIVRNFKPSSWIINYKDGNRIHEHTKAAEWWWEYCEKLCPNQSFRPDRPVEVVIESEPNILIPELEDVIRKVQKNKALGPDQIITASLKGLRPNGIASLHKICNSIWQTGLRSSDWVHSSIIPLHKEGSIYNGN